MQDVIRKIQSLMRLAERSTTPANERNAALNRIKAIASELGIEPPKWNGKAFEPWRQGMGMDGQNGSSIADMLKQVLEKGGVEAAIPHGAR